MIDTWQDVVIIAGMCSVGVIWVAAVVGMMQIGWKSIASPVTEWIKEKKE
jgi:hypothetical protein|tara:strand:+ start:254 stop:403 length:150 start_codon:yes stop_codon:yes gene_type:complete